MCEPSCKMRRYRKAARFNIPIVSLLCLVLSLPFIRRTKSWHHGRCHVVSVVPPSLPARWPGSGLASRLQDRLRARLQAENQKQQPQQDRMEGKEIIDEMAAELADGTRDGHFIALPLAYAQTAAAATLPGGDEAVRSYLSRPGAELLHDVADGQLGGLHGTLRVPGRPTLWVEDVDIEKRIHIIHYPPGQWVAPGGLGSVNVSGPQVLVHLEDIDADAAAPKSVPEKDFQPQWHITRAFAHAHLMNGRNLCQAAVTLPLVPTIRFNVSISCDFVMEMGFAGAGETEDGYTTMGLDGKAGLSLPRFPGANTLMSLFMPKYARKAMQDAADGTARTFKALAK